MLLSRPLSLLSAMSFAFVGSACQSSPDGGSAASPAARASAKPRKPVDRLAPGELAEGNEKVFGLAVPRGMKLERQFVGAAHMVGRVKPEDVANYVRERVEVERVEIGAARTVFPRVYIKGDLSRKVFRIEVVADGATTKLVIKDLTRPKAPEGLSEAERWRRAGFSPDGKPLNPKKLE